MVPPPLFPDEAEAALAVFKSLHVVDVPGRPTFGECAAEWVFDFVRLIFGAYDARTAQRAIRNFLLLISKKNGKSTIAAGIMLTALIRNWRHSAELLILAPTLEGAGNAYKPAAEMVRADPELESLLYVQDNLRQITHRVTKATLKVVAADTDTVVGKKAGFVLVDELWAFGRRHNAGAMLAEAIGGMISRPEGFVIYLTTQSDEPPAGVFKDKLDHFRNVRDGVVSDPKSFGLLYEFPKEMIESRAYLEPANWHITNPNLGRSVSAEWLGDELAAAQRGDVGQLNVFLAKHLNVEIGNRLRSDRWPGAEHWADAGCDAALSLQDLLDRSEVVVMGADGGGLDDLLGFAVLGREKGTRRWLLWNWAACYEGVLERRKEIATLLRDLEKAGELYIAESLGDDMDEMKRIVSAVVASGKLPGENAMGYDPYGIGGVLMAARDAGVKDSQFTSISQGFRLHGAIGTTERALADGTLKHAGQSLMAWCVTNAKSEPKGNARLITKAASGTGKIDPLMATFNAVSLMNLDPAARGRSFWDRE